MASKSNHIYIGVTNNLMRRVAEHKEEKIEGFTKKYKMKKLVYFERFGSAIEAINRETKLKGWLRKRKVELIESTNPQWNDLSLEWENERMRGSSCG
jgi:putative endonuclease